MSSVAERRAAARRRKILAAGENRMSQVMNLVEGTRVKPADAADDAPAVAIDAPTVASSAPEAAAPAKVDWRERMKKRRAAAVAAAGPAASPDEMLEAAAREMLDDDDGGDAEEQATASSSSSSSSTTAAATAAAAAVARVEAAAVSAPSPAETRRNVAALRRRRRQQQQEQQQQDSTDATGGTKEGEPAEKPKAPPPRADGKPDPLARWRAAEAEKEAKKEAAAGAGPGGMLGSLASMAGIPGLAGGGDGAVGGDAAAAAAAAVAAGSKAEGGGGAGADAGGKAKPGSLRLIVEKQRLEAQQMHLRGAALVLCALCCAGFACTGAAAETWGAFAGLGGGSGGGAAAAAATLQPYIELFGQLGDIDAVEQKMQAAKHGHLVDELHRLYESGGLEAAAGGGGGGDLAYISAFDDGPGLFSAPVGYARHLLGEMTLFPPFLLLVVGHRLLADASFRLLHGQPLLGGGGSNSAAPGAMGLMGTAMASYGYVKALVADFSLFLFIVIMSMALFSIATNGF